MNTFHRARSLVLMTAIAAMATTTFAQTWPARPLTVVVPFPAGGGTDLVIRAIQPELQRELGQPLVIDNRGGAGGTIGSTAVARAPADGYVLGIATTSTHAVSRSVYRKLPYDPIADFEYAGFIGTSPYVLAVHPGLGAVDAGAVIAALKKAPDRYSYASVGAGTVSHLLAEKFKQQVGVSLVHVPYRGASPAYIDLIAGTVQVMFDNPVGLAPYIRAGKVQAVATTGPNALVADVPTFAQQGLPGLDQLLWYGVVFPKGTPPAIVQRFNAALNKVLSNRSVAAELSAKGVDAKPGPPQALRTAAASDADFWGRIAKSVGATLD
ncbi:Bug family tripartite tricarboxylate transporter substrate binding protein [Variovorax sp. RA8]|uniref:Bug family tripartite tricarboxylate transporter substrate binding protein n=1 Tax=Variovorax sp. (strain JCM 16519 / RA8) TaxID=662548 RepID=UPI000ABE455A|nr:tripartite tricarboxylate transporter substrate-binding protein [Variovorax sp. RA8]VTU38538.1 Argininosuccinate lyase [Variovorax sp. RA8]